MADNEITDIGVMSGIPYGTAPLSADMQYLETYTSSALNRKLKGIVLPGFYLGFAPVAGTGLNVTVTSKDASGTQGAASIDVNAHQITIQHIADLTIPVVAGKTTRVVLEANYKVGTKTDQVDTTSTVKAARVFAQDLSVPLADNQLELCRVVVPSGTTQITQPMIITTYRINRQVGLTLDSINTSDDELIAANLKGLKILKGLIDARMAIEANGADIKDPDAFRKNISLDQVTNDKQLKAAQNLADLPNVVTARKSLGLGTAALSDKQVSAIDMTPGALMSVGAFGLGAPSYVMANSITTLADSTVTELNAFWTLSAVFTDGPIALGAASQSIVGQMFNMRRWYAAGAALVQLLVVQGGTMYIRTGAGGAGAWKFDGTTVGADKNGWRKVMDSASMTLADLTGLGAAKAGANSDITSMDKLTNINTDTLTLSKYLEVKSQILSGYRMGIMRADAFPAYMNFARFDQLDGTPPSSETGVMNIWGRLASTTTDAWAGRILGGLVISNMPHGGGKTYIEARNSNGSTAAKFALDSGSGEANFTGAGGLVVNGGGGVTADGAGQFTSDSIVLQVRQKTKDKSYYIRGKKSDNTLHWYIGQSTDSTDTVTWGNSIPNTWFTLAADGTGNTNVSTMNFRGDVAVVGGLDVSNGARFTGPVNIVAKGAASVGDLTAAALVVSGSSGDGTQGLTINSFAPSLTFVDRSGNSAAFRWKGDGNYLRLESDNRDNGATWNSYNTLFSEQGHLSIGGGGGSVSRMFTLGYNTAGNANLTGATQIVAMTYANIGADATTRAIGWGAEMTFGDGTTAQTLADAVEFWGNSNIVNANATVNILASFRSWDKTNTNISTAYAFDGRQMSRNGVNRWNLFMQGSAPNFIRGQTIIGGTDTTLPASNLALDVRGEIRTSSALTVEGGAKVSASLTLGYRQMFQRNGAPGYQTFSRDDVTASPTADTELGRIAFGYGMSGTDSWGTGGVMGFINGNAQKDGGGKLNIAAMNSAGSVAAGMNINGAEARVDFIGTPYFANSLRANNYIDLGYQNGTAGKRQITFYSGSNTTSTAYIKVDGATPAASTMVLAAGETQIQGDLRVSGTINFDGMLYANKHDVCINFSSTDATKPIVGINYSGAGNFGFWDSTNGAWVLRKDTSDNWIMPQKLTAYGDVVTAGELVSNSGDNNNARFSNGKYSAIHRVNGSNYYILLTDLNDSTGTYNSLRPITVQLSSGLVSFGHSAKVTGDLTVTGLTTTNTLNITQRISIGNAGTGNFNTTSGSINIGDSDTGLVCPGDGLLDIYCNNAKQGQFKAGGLNLTGSLWTGGGASFIATDGNVYGGVWGGYLSTYIGNRNNDVTNLINDRYHAARFTNVRNFSSGGNDWGNAIVCFVGDFGASDGYGRVCDLQLYKQNAGWLTVGIG